MRSVNNGWLVRYTHANVASFFFIFVYLHVARGIYYGSFKSPRVLVWSIGCIILILLMAIGFLGYVLPYGQMSLWGYFTSPTCKLYKFTVTKMCNIISNNIQIIIINSISILSIAIYVGETALSNKIRGVTSITNKITRVNSITNKINSVTALSKKVKDIDRIGPHNDDVLSIIFGSLLGGAHAEKRGFFPVSSFPSPSLSIPAVTGAGGGRVIKSNCVSRVRGSYSLGGTRICFYQESKHLTFILWLQNFLANRGYCNIRVPESTTRLGEGGKVRKVLRFKTWTYTSFNWIHDIWYSNDIKLVPKNIANYLTPLALAIWIMNDASKSSKGFKLCTNSFTFQDCQCLSQVLQDNFNLKSSVKSAGAPNQYFIYIHKESMPLLITIVSPYILPSMKYKII